jgi:hypothetical protein
VAALPLLAQKSCLGHAGHCGFPLSETVPLRPLPIGRTVTNQLRGSYPFLKPVTVVANQLALDTLATLPVWWVESRG